MMRRSFLFPLLAVVAAALVYSAWWFYAGRAAIRAFDDWVAVQRSEGYAITYGTLSFGGFPAQVDLTIPEIAVSLPGRLWEANGDGLTVSFHPWNLSEYDLNSIGPLRLRSAVLPETRDMPIVVTSLAGQYRRHPEDGYHAADLILRDLSGPLDFRAQEVALRGIRPFQHALGVEDLVATMDLELVDMALPKGVLPPGLPDTVDAGVLKIDVFGPEPPGPASFAKRLTDWREAGGLIEIRDIALVWQDLNLQGKGTATIDRFTRPELSLSVQVSGVTKTAARFEAAGLINRSVREAVEIGVNILSLGAGDSSRIRMPISIQQGQVYLGPAAVGEVGPLLPGRSVPERLQPAHRVQRAVGEPALPPPPPTVSEETWNAQ